MSRNAASQAQQTYRMGRSLENQSLANSNALYDQLEPTFQNEAVNPQGFNPKDMADMTTGAMQSSGGALGAVTGKANQYAAANRNSGSFTPVLDEASRAASRNLSNTNLDIKKSNADLKESQRQAGIKGLSGLQSEQNADVLGSLGLMNQSTDAMTKASPGWFQNFTSLLQSLQGAGASKGADGSWAFGA